MKLKKGKRKQDYIPPGSGIEVVFENDWFNNYPKCEHGPMLLFERFSNGKKAKSFYACAANRDRKMCNAYVQKGDEKKKKGHIYGTEVKKTNTHYMKYDTLSSAPLSKIIYCFHCKKFILPDDNSNHPINHRLKKNITEEEILRPSTVFLTPLENTKVNSQFLINKESTSFLYTSLYDLKVTDVVCLGMPRLHEHIQCASLKGDKNLNSVLLDMDERYVTFWPKDKFIHFNMFNQHFFREEGKKSWNNFLADCIARNGKIAVVLDPPFGGLVDAIAECLKWMTKAVKEAATSQNVIQDCPDSLLLFWLFPYFVEPRIKEAYPSLTMLDYQVAYENHKKFKGAQSGRYLSPVRIYTNAKNKDIKLPSDNYRFCDQCQRYVSNNNVHCKFCKTCPSKDGRTYVHCKKCRKCVKPGRQHCKECNRCEAPEHECRTAADIVCHNCNQLGHKRRNCPVENKEN